MLSGLPTLQFDQRPGILDLGWGHPHPDGLPVDAWLAATDTVLTVHGRQALAYGYGAGPASLREWLADRISTVERSTCPPSSIFVSAGASQALEILAAMLTRPGDVVIVDSPTYHLALRILQDAGVDLIAAPADEYGIDPGGTAELVSALRREGRTVRLVYLVPTFGNPTGSSLPHERRTALVEVARRIDMTILEDDTYREFAYDSVAPPSLWSVADGGNVIRLGSFAKSVAPGLRLGWINARPDLIAALERRGYVDSGGGVNHMVAMTMAVFGSSGAYDRHLDVTRPRYARQRDTLVRAVRRNVPDVDLDAPAGGWFVWIRLPDPMSATRLRTVAEEHGVSFAEGSRFYVNGRGDDHARLSFSMLGVDDLTEAVSRLAAATRVCGR
jgi:2-aminoadipate transaminase